MRIHVSIPLQREELALIKLLCVKTMSVVRQRVREHHTPTIAGGRYLLKDVNMNGPNIHLTESDLRRSELIGGQLT